MSNISDFFITFFPLIFVVFILAATIQFLFTSIIHGRLSFYKKREYKPTEKAIPVSIIIAARNDSDNLYENLPSILEQDYPEFEVIVVNNQSIDESGWLLTAFQQQFKNLRVVELEKNKHLRPGKKLPITLAIKAAKYEHFLLTDADCKPKSNQWISKMSNQFSSKNEIIIGYAPYIKGKGFLNNLIRFDTAWVGINYFSMALAKLPYMAVGRNLAYTKKVFHSVNGFKSHYAIPSGDDDLFIQEAAKKSNYSVEIDPETFCYSPAPNTWSTWMAQKAKLYATSNRHRLIKKSLLGIYPISVILMWFLFVPLLFSTDFRNLSIAIFIAVMAYKWLIQGRCMMKLKENNFVKFLPFWDLLYAILMPIIYYVTERQKFYKW